MRKLLVALLVFTVALQILPNHVESPLNWDAFKKPKNYHMDRLLFMPAETEYMEIFL